MKIIVKLAFCLLLMVSCGGNDDSPPVVNERVIGNFNLVFPDNNHICTSGDYADDNNVAIEFSWTAAENANGYLLEITDQNTQEVTSLTSSTIEKSVSISKATQFSWKVTALQLEKTKESDSGTWSFYSQGIPEENYSPFPADISVVDNENGTIEIEWTGSDLDNDIELYEVYFGNSNEPILIASKDNDSESVQQSITYGVEYYLKIISIDSRGHKSIAKKVINFQG